MSKTVKNDEFDYVLLNAQILRRCTRINIFQLLSFAFVVIFVFYLGRHSKACENYYQIFESTQLNFSITTIDEDYESQNISTTISASQNFSADYLDVLKKNIKCYDKKAEFRIERRGAFWVLKNYIPAKIHPNCYETITYTTHGDYSFLDNLIPLLKRWMAPISIAIYSPGTDYDDALNSIIYLRNCIDEQELIRDLVTFHLYFDRLHTPQTIIKNVSLYETQFECKSLPPFLNSSHATMYKKTQNLTYPVNVGRNIAREAAVTHFVLPSDIELYPNPGLTIQFLKMISHFSPKFFEAKQVFVLPIFEVQSSVSPPTTKFHLQKMLQSKLAIPFHFKICSTCHSVPGQKEWINALSVPSEMKIHATSKRVGKFGHWEPIFIGTHSEPLYEELLSWEGKSDKMTQGYTLCLLDYDFHVLSEGFLVHRPGIKTVAEAHRPEMERKSLNLIKSQIVPQIEALYGTRPGCKP
uniref:CSON000499 protein n=1 Tax=Culicoides sonorensis TaxID=179676 RepID=A0A336MES0_CULSO